MAAPVDGRYRSERTWHAAKGCRCSSGRCYSSQTRDKMIPLCLVDVGASAHLDDLVLYVLGLARVSIC